MPNGDTSMTYPFPYKTQDGVDGFEFSSIYINNGKYLINLSAFYVTSSYYWYYPTGPGLAGQILASGGGVGPMYWVNQGVQSVTGSLNLGIVTNSAGAVTITPLVSGAGHFVLQVSPTLTTPTVNTSLELSNSMFGVSLDPTYASENYSWFYPSTPGTAGQLLVSGGGSNAMAWVTTGTGGIGTVTYVGLSVPPFLSVTPSAITNSGTFAVTLSGAPLPFTSGGTGLSSIGAGPASVLTSNGSSLSWQVPTTGTVTSIGMVVPSFLAVTPASITASGTFTITAPGATGSGGVVLDVGPVIQGLTVSTGGPATSDSSAALVVTGGIASTENLWLGGNFTTSLTGAQTNVEPVNIFAEPVISASSAVSFPGAATVLIQGAPTAGTNVTIVAVPGTPALVGLQVVGGIWTDDLTVTGDTSVLGNFTVGDALVRSETEILNVGISYLAGSSSYYYGSTGPLPTPTTAPFLYIGQDLQSGNSYIPMVSWYGLEGVTNPLLNIGVLTSGQIPTITFGSNVDYVMQMFWADTAWGTAFFLPTGGGPAGNEIMFVGITEDVVPTITMGGTTVAPQLTIKTEGPLSTITSLDALTTTVSVGIMSFETSAGDMNFTVVGGGTTFDMGGGTLLYTMGGGDISYTMGAGNISYTMGGGAVEYTTGGGAMTFTMAAGTFAVTTGAGDISLTTGAGTMTLTTGAGEMALSVGAGGLNITSGAGEIGITTGVGEMTFTIGDGGILVTAAVGDISLTSAVGLMTFTSGVGVMAFDVGVGGLVTTVLAGGVSTTVTVGDYKVDVVAGDLNLTCTVGTVEIAAGTVGDCTVYSQAGNTVLNSNNGAVQLNAPYGGVNIGYDTASPSFAGCGQFMVRTSYVLGGKDGTITFDATNGNVGSIYMYAKGVIEVLSNGSAGGVYLDTSGVSTPYYWNFPSTGGVAGQVLVSGGGTTGTTPMTWVSTSGSGSFVLGINPTFSPASSATTSPALTIQNYSGSPYSVGINPFYVTASYSLYLPATLGLAGTLLTSGGASGVMTWSTTTGSGSVVALQTGPTFLAPTGASTTPNLKLTNFAAAYTVSLSTYGIGANYNWVYPNNAGTAGQVLASGGGGAAPMTWVSAAGGSVTSVDATLPSFLSISGNPITTAGTLAITYSGTALPVSSGGTGLVAVGSSGQVLTVVSGAPAWAAPASSGTVTSVGLAVPPIFTVSGSPVTGSGTISINYSGAPLPVLNGGTGATTATGSGSVVLQTTPTVKGSIEIMNLIGSNNIVISAPASGLASYTFALPASVGTVGQVLTSQAGSNMTWTTPAVGSVTSVALTVPSFLSVAGSPITSSGTLALSYSGSALPVLNGGTGVTTSTGNGAVVLQANGTMYNYTIADSNSTSSSYALTLSGSTGIIYGTQQGILEVTSGAGPNPGNMVSIYAPSQGSGNSISKTFGQSNTTGCSLFERFYFNTTTALNTYTMNLIGESPSFIIGTAGISITGGPLTLSTPLAYTSGGTGLGSLGSSGQVLTIVSGAPTWATPSAPGTGTVTSVAASVPSFLSIAGSPITTSGTLAVSYSGTALPVANGGTGATTSTGSGAVVLQNNPLMYNVVMADTVGSSSSTALNVYGNGGITYSLAQGVMEITYGGGAPGNLLMMYASGLFSGSSVNRTFGKAAATNQCLVESFYYNSALSGALNTYTMTLYGAAASFVMGPAGFTITGGVSIVSGALAVSQLNGNFLDNTTTANGMIVGYNTPQGSTTSNTFVVYDNSTSRTELFTINQAGSSSGSSSVNFYPGNTFYGGTTITRNVTYSSGGLPATNNIWWNQSSGNGEMCFGNGFSTGGNKAFAFYNSSLTNLFSINSNGNAVLAGSLTASNLTKGTWTPTFAGIPNSATFSSSTVTYASYSVSGNTVTCWLSCTFAWSSANISNCYLSIGGLPYNVIYSGPGIGGSGSYVSNGGASNFWPIIVEPVNGTNYTNVTTYVAPNSEQVPLFFTGGSGRFVGSFSYSI